MTLDASEYLSDPGADKIGKYQRPGDASETQILAALEALPGTGAWRRRVLRTLRDYEEGLTDEEIQTILEINPSTERPRRVELVEGGWVFDSGKRRKTRSGRMAVVWILTPGAWGYIEGGGTL